MQQNTSGQGIRSGVSGSFGKCRGKSAPVTPAVGSLFHGGAFPGWQPRCCGFPNGRSRAFGPSLLLGRSAAPKWRLTCHPAWRSATVRPAINPLADPRRAFVPHAAPDPETYGVRRSGSAAARPSAASASAIRLVLRSGPIPSGKALVSGQVGFAFGPPIRSAIPIRHNFLGRTPAPFRGREECREAFPGWIGAALGLTRP